MVFATSWYGGRTTGELQGRTRAGTPGHTLSEVCRDKGKSRRLCIRATKPPSEVECFISAVSPGLRAQCSVLSAQCSVLSAVSPGFRHPGFPQASPHQAFSNGACCVPNGSRTALKNAISTKLVCTSEKCSGSLLSPNDPCPARRVLCPQWSCSPNGVARESKPKPYNRNTRRWQ
jgi:hypothetical protein